MNKQLIITELQNAHASFWKEAGKIPAADFNKPFNGKWSAAQNVKHINISVAQMSKYLGLPKEVIGEKFGFANRPSKPVEEANAQYTEALKRGIKAPQRFIPDEEEKSVGELTDTGNSTLQIMIATLQSWTEEDLDKYFCPHPALGNLTVREMLYFTAQHARHHQKAISKIEESLPQA